MLVNDEGPTMSGKPLIREEQVVEISRLCDAAERNYQITQSYHDFSHALARALGDTENANWSTFACWASKTAGESIRSEELPRAFKHLFASERRIHRRVGWIFDVLHELTGTDVNLLDDASRSVAEVSRQIGEGNLKVYAELGPVFARFISALEAEDETVEHKLRGFYESLLPGETEAGGQALLKQAFTSYERARLTRDAKEKAELMLLGNCLVGLHEQTRLQPNIKDAIGAPVCYLLVAGITSQGPARLAFGLFGFLGITEQSLLSAARTEWERLVTRYVMDLSLPGGTEIPLGGEQVPWPNAIPTALMAPTNPELITLLGRFDDNILELRRRGADNWTDLNDRMGYIVELFRSQQQDRRLFEAPFPGGLPTLTV